MRKRSVAVEKREKNKNKTPNGFWSVRGLLPPTKMSFTTTATTTTNRKRRRVEQNERHDPEKKDFDLPCPLVSFYNLKKNVGKTITSVNYAKHVASDEGKKVLLLDLDSHCDLTYMLDPKIRTFVTESDDNNNDVTTTTTATPPTAPTVSNINFDELVSEHNNIVTLWKREVREDDDDKNQDRDENNDDDTKLLELVFSHPSSGGEVWFLRGSHLIDTVIDHALHTMYNVSLRWRFALVFMLKKIMQNGSFDMTIADLSPNNSVLNRSVLFASTTIIVPAFADRTSMLTTYVTFKNVLRNLPTMASMGPSSRTKLQYVYRPNVLCVVTTTTITTITTTNNNLFQCMVDPFADLFINQKPYVSQCFLVLSNELLQRIGPQNIVPLSSSLHQQTNQDDYSKIELWTYEMKHWSHMIYLFFKRE